MEIVPLINETWQLTDESGTVLMQGTYDKCLDRLCELENKGTDHELCLAVNIRETDPPIIKPEN